MELMNRKVTVFLAPFRTEYIIAFIANKTDLFVPLSHFACSPFRYESKQASMRTVAYGLFVLESTAQAGCKMPSFINHLAETRVALMCPHKRWRPLYYILACYIVYRLTSTILSASFFRYYVYKLRRQVQTLPRVFI